MRILRGLSSRLLLCGCLAGVYETYDKKVVGILDARGRACADPAHQPGQSLTADDLNSTGATDPVAVLRTPRS